MRTSLKKSGCHTQLYQSCGKFKVILKFEGFRGKQDPFQHLASLANSLIYWQNARPWSDETGRKLPASIPKGQYTDFTVSADGDYVITIVLEISSPTPLKWSQIRAYEKYLEAIGKELTGWEAIENIELTTSFKAVLKIK